VLFAKALSTTQNSTAQHKRTELGGTREFAAYLCCDVSATGEACARRQWQKWGLQNKNALHIAHAHAHTRPPLEASHWIGRVWGTWLGVPVKQRRSDEVARVVAVLCGVTEGHSEAHVLRLGCAQCHTPSFRLIRHNLRCVRPQAVPGGRGVVDRLRSVSEI
jgi:hypothetical protein